MRTQLLAPALVLSFVSLAGAAPQEAGARPRTFTAQEWAEKPGADTPQAWALAQNFKAWFPDGLVLGDVDGIDNDQHAALVLRSVADVTRALTSSPDAGATTLTADRSGAEGVVLGNLGRQILATKLNLAYDTATAQTGLATYTYGVRAPQGIQGLRVAQTLKFANRAYSGEFGRPSGAQGNEKNIVDVDGKGGADASLADLAGALLQLNTSFSTTIKQKAVVFAPGAKDPDVVAPKDGVLTPPVLIPVGGAGSPTQPVPQVKPEAVPAGAGDVTSTPMTAAEREERAARRDERYLTEIAKLKADLAQVTSERDRALAMIGSQKSDNQRLTDALAKTESDAKTIERLTKENEKLTRESEKLTKDNDKLTRERDKLTKENEKLAKDSERMTKAVERADKQALKHAEDEATIEQLKKDNERLTEALKKLKGDGDGEGDSPDKTRERGKSRDGGGGR